jgi:hypothetical protein
VFRLIRRDEVAVEGGVPDGTPVPPPPLSADFAVVAIAEERERGGAGGEAYYI